MAQDPSQLNHALYALRDHLSLAREKGCEQVVLSPESLDQLAALPMALMKMSSTSPPAVSAAGVKEMPPSQPAQSEPIVTGETVALFEDPVANPAPVAAASTAISSGLRAIEKLEPEGSSKKEKLNNLYRMARDCEACRALETLRSQIVFATGNPDAELMLVGEAPGEEEEKQKKPFVGPAGQKLDGIIKAMGLTREAVYISNIVKYRPMKGDGRFQGPQNRKPTTEEMSVSLKYIMAEIEVVKPKVIVACGGTAAEGLLDIGGSVSRMRGQFHDLNGTPVMVTYHPSYLLRSESDPDGGKAKKRMVWEDMLLVMEKMGLTISEKQRSYFA